MQADFDVDAAFGTFVCTDENDDWLNIYANYDIAAVEADYEKAADELSRAQLALDAVNQRETFEWEA
mgnify:FL=1